MPHFPELGHVTIPHCKRKPRKKSVFLTFLTLNYEAAKENELGVTLEKLISMFAIGSKQYWVNTNHTTY